MDVFMNLDDLTFAHRFDAISGSAIREILKLTVQPGMIPSPAETPRVRRCRMK